MTKVNRSRQLQRGVTLEEYERLLRHVNRCARNDRRPFQVEVRGHTTPRAAQVFLVELDFPNLATVTVTGMEPPRIQVRATSCRLLEFDGAEQVPASVRRANVRM